MNIKFRQLKAFSLAARLASFTKAADAMAITQPSFSNLIKELEADLGLVLFDRSTRRCTLTDAGTAFEQQMGSAVDHVEELYQQMSETGRGRRGRLVVAAIASMSFGVIPRALADYRREFPNVEFILSERKNTDVFAAVRQREAELGVGSLLQPDPTLRFLPLFTDQLMLVVPKGSPLEGTRPTWRMLESQPYIMMRTGPAEHALRANNIHVRTAFEVDHVATAVAMVRNGLGITALPSSVIPALNLDGVGCMPIAGRQAIRTIAVAHRRNVPLSRVAETFVNVLRKAGKQHAPLPARGQERGTSA